jgi:DNA gyrase inhibitor GyrI
MSCFSSFSSKKILDHIYSNGRSITYVPPVTLYIGLFRDDNGLANNTPAQQDEVQGGAYARKALDGSENYFRPANGFEALLHADVDWATATEDWGTVNHAAILDAATGGNVLLWSPLTTAKLIETNDIMGVLATDLVASLASVGMSVYSAKKALDHLLSNGRAQTYTPPSSLYVALFTSSGGLSSNTPALQTEVTGGAYARKRLNGSDNYIGPAADFAAALYADINWEIATSNWGQITHLAIMDGETGGNVISYGALTSPKTIETNDRAVIKAGQLVASLT